MSAIRIVGPCGLLLVLGCAAARAQAHEIDELLAAARARGEFSGVVLAARDGRIVHHRGYGLADRTWRIANETTTRFPLGTATNQWTAVVAIRLVAAGRLTLDAKVADQLPAFRTASEPGLTLSHLLHHRSGLPRLDEVTRGTAELTRLSPAELHERIAGGKRAFPPGSRFRDCNSDYVILKAVLEATTGKPWADLVREMILEPLGLADTGFLAGGKVVPRLARAYTGTSSGMAEVSDRRLRGLGGAGAAFTTAADLYAYDRALRSPDLLDDAARRMLLTPDASGRDDVAPGHLVYSLELPGPRSSRISERRGTGGGFTHLMVRGLDADWCLIVLANGPCPGLHDLNHQRGLAWELVCRLTAAEPAKAAVPSKLIGRWYVTLCAGGANPTGETELVITEAGGGKLSGRFYGSLFEESWLIETADDDRLAFTTGDASHDYYSVATRAGDRLRGFTLCPGRDFLATWTARRLD